MERITEKRLKNKRFKHSEECIVTALLIAKDKLNLNKIIRIAHISRSTLHRHHGNINDIIPNYEKYILRKWKTRVKHLSKIKSLPLKFFYERLLSFLSSNRQITELLLKYDDHVFIEQFIVALKPHILTTGRITDGEVFTLYTKETAGLIEAWCDDGFDIDAIPSVVSKIMYLTNTAYARLSPLARFNSSTNR